MDDRGAPGGLHRLIRARREDLLVCWEQRTREALSPGPLPHPELVDHMPALVDDLAAALYPGAVPLPSGVDHAQSHGAHRLRLGFDVWEVVREYGLIEECVIDLATAAQLAVPGEDQKNLAAWMNKRLADAVSQYVRQRDAERDRQASEHLGFLAHELRNPLNSARLALDRLRSVELSRGGRAVEVLDRNLRRTSQLIEDALAQASLRLGLEPRIETIALRPFIEELERDATIDGHPKSIRIDVAVAPELTVEADPRLLRSVLTNFLANAVKFSRPNTEVRIAAARTDLGVTIDVADACGGLPAGKAEELFKPLVQRGANRSGYGLGLAIASEAAAAHSGHVGVRDVPGQGCVFSLTLPDPIGRPVTG
jgi:signal transduction histidine kinase